MSPKLNDAKVFGDLTVYNTMLGLDKWGYIDDSLHHSAHEFQGRDHLDDHSPTNFKVVTILIITVPRTSRS